MEIKYENISEHVRNIQELIGHIPEAECFVVLTTVVRKGEQRVEAICLWNSTEMAKDIFAQYFLKALEETKKEQTNDRV